MLASIGKEVPEGPRWSFEPKYDGIRILAYAAIAKLAPRRRPFVLDGEIVALQKRRGRSVPGRFQQLQSRMQLGDPALVAARSRAAPVAYYVFDVLMSAGTPLVDLPQAKRPTGGKDSSPSERTRRMKRGSAHGSGSSSSWRSSRSW
jgi:bifunctional non-homologous end joining protein LigD